MSWTGEDVDFFFENDLMLVNSSVGSRGYYEGHVTPFGNIFLKDGTVQGWADEGSMLWDDQIGQWYLYTNGTWKIVEGSNVG